MTLQIALMWTAAITLALVAATNAVYCVAVAIQEYLNWYRVRGLTRAQIGECRALAAQYRRENGASNGPVSPPVDPVNPPRWKPDTKETDQ